MEAGGGGVMGGDSIKWGEYGRPEMFMPNTSGQVVNAQQIVEALRSSGVNLGGGGNLPSIETMNIYTNDGTNAVLYGVDKYMGLAVAI